MGLKVFLIVIAMVNPSETESFDYYVSQLRTQYESVGAKPVRYPINHTLLGGESPDFIMIVEFPDAAAVQKLFSSEAYKKLVPYREKGFKELKVYLSTEE